MSSVMDLAVAALTGATTVAGAWATGQRAKKARKNKDVIAKGKQELDSRRVESEAYANAQKINKDVVEELHSELDRLRKDLRAERDGRAEDNRRHAGEITELRNLIGQLRTELDVTRAQLRIPNVPAAPPASSEGA